MMNIYSYSLFIIFFLQQHVLGGSRWCYECGTGVTGSPDCLTFALSSSWQPFLRECSDDHVCVKIEPAWNSSLASRVQRGCSPQHTLSGFKHQPGCWGHDSTAFISCFCYEDSCNGVLGLQIPRFIIFGVVFVLLIIVTCCY